MAELDLDRRRGLPDDIAYLRATFPQAEWRAHANFGELTRFWLHVHESLRHHGRQLETMTQEFREGRLDTSQFQGRFVSGLNQFLGHLNAHHEIEDSEYFPKFRGLDPRMAAGFDLLEADHLRIHEALLATAGSANQLLTAMANDRDAVQRAADAYADRSGKLLALLMQHLADEEDLVLPAMLAHGERSVA